MFAYGWSLLTAIPWPTVSAHTSLCHRLRGKAPLRKYIRNGDGKVRPICIPTEKCSGGSGAGCFIGREATMAGWGLLQQNSNVRPDVLQVGAVELLIADSKQRPPLGLTWLQFNSHALSQLHLGTH